MKESFESVNPAERPKKPILDIAGKMRDLNVNLKFEKESDPVSVSYDHDKKSVKVGVNQDIVKEKIRLFRRNRGCSAPPFAKIHR
jgi:hypothetical protein